MPDTSASQSAYLRGSLGTGGYAYAYTAGGDNVTTSQSCFLKGRVGVTTSLSAYLSGIGTAKSSIHAFINGPVVRTSISCYLEGQSMEVPYIELKTSDAGATLSKKFRVIAAGYDDGQLEKAETLERTLGGGLDYNAGAVYQTWNPIIRVRHTEPVSGYGTLDELKTFYTYNNPNGTPSNKITFIDNHQQSYTVYIVGPFKKSMMGIKIEGDQAWFTIALRLVEVP